MIDFGKIGTGNIVDTVLPPREIFNALPNKNAHKFQYPRDVQSQVWAKWFDRRDENSLVVKMNTGGGKTVVGLLLLKSCLNEDKYPAAYICPDNYLVKQVLDAAKELGLEVTSDAKSHRFLSGKAILVANIQKLVNGRSVFGVGDEGSKIPVSSFVIDDAHACIDTVESQFTANIPSDSKAYEELYLLFKTSLHAECQSKAIEIESGDNTNYMQVPYWIWQEKIAEISQILIKHKDEKFLEFVWPLIKENPNLSHCVISAGRIEISPHVTPIHMIPSIVNANRKIFMTATLVDDSILSSHFSVDEQYIKHPIVPESAGDIGDRMILLPQVINPDITENDIKDYAKYLSNYLNVVVIVPSRYRSSFWEDVADLILDTESITAGVEKLKAGHVGLTVLINRYDGVDLPGDACRFLVIDGLPDVRKQIDKVKQSVLLGSGRLVNQTIQKIEQGMGRGVRSNDDYCVVMLTGRDLTNQLYSQGAVNKLSSGTKAQLDLSEQIAEQIKGLPIGQFTDVLNYCFAGKQEWLTVSKGALASLKYSGEGNLDTLTFALRKAYDAAANNNPQLAATFINQVVGTVADDKERGYLKQHLAEYTNMYDQVEAQKIQLSGVTDNRRILKPIAGIQYHKLSGEVLDQAVACSNFLTAKFQDPNKLLIEVKGVLSKLEFKPKSANNFEEAMKVIARYLGLEGQRPEQEYGKGPDNLWKIGALNYLVIECKNEAVATTICKDYCNQLNGSCEWFEQKYDQTCSYTPVMVHPSTLFEYACSPNPNIRIMTVDKLKAFCSAVDAFITAIAGKNELGNQNAIREKLVAYRLRPVDFVEMYTEPHRVKN